MKKIIAGLLVVLMTLSTVAPVQAAEEGRGGIVGFIAGCCFGVRSGADYNSGKNLHWREWGMLIPIFNLYVWILNGVDGASGTTKADLAEQYGSTYY